MYKIISPETVFIAEGVVVDETIWQQVCELAAGSKGDIEDLSSVDVNKA